VKPEDRSTAGNVDLIGMGKCVTGNQASASKRAKGGSRQIESWLEISGPDKNVVCTRGERLSIQGETTDLSEIVRLDEAVPKLHRVGKFPEHCAVLRVNSRKKETK